VNGAAGSKVIGVGAGDSAKTVAANVNAQTSVTGVTASARTEVDATALKVSDSFTLTLKSDNTTAVTISFSTGAVANADGLAAAINAFNDKTSQTGVSAKLNAAGSGITLTNASGNDIALTNSSATGTLTVGGAAMVVATGVAYVTGAVTLDSEKTFGVISTTGAAGVSYFLGNVSSQLQAASTLDVSTVDSATRTLSTVDSALAAVNGQRASFGALQSRFDTTISNLHTTSENLSASRSRIQDADFAAETANLSRAQILQQAGTAMVAQANQLPQGVLALLR
jgi:flagellin